MILAWAWTSSLALAGAVLAAGPILIHLLNRRRFRLLDWAAMRFLLESQRKNRRRLRLEELILLALRVLVCLLLGLALANIRGGALLGGSAASVTHVFILDDSLSMGQRVGADSLFRKATTHLADLVGSMPGSDRVAFLSATGSDGQEFFGRLVFAQDLQGDRAGEPARPAGPAKRRAASLLTSLKPGDLGANFPEALAAAEKILAQEPGAARRLYLVSDFRRAEWTDRAAVENLRRAFARLAALGTEIVLMDYGAPAASNLTVESLELLDKIAVAKQKVRFQARVRNFGTEPAAGASLTVQVGPVTLPAAALGSIGPGERVGLPFSYTFPEVGPAAVKVSVTPDVLPADNTAALALGVRDAVRVLVVDGSPDPTNPVAGAGYCLARAIDPKSNGEFGQRCDVTGVEGLPDVRFDDYDAVILAGVGEFPAGRDDKGQLAYPQLEALARYVRGGGGLAIFVGDRVNLDFYNGPMLAGGAGLCPLRIGAPVPAVPDATRFVRLRPDSIAAEPMLRVFTGRGEAFARLVRFYVYMPAIEAALPAAAEGVGPVQVLARFDDRESSPAVAKRAFGRGTVMMWYSSADVRWTDWPKDLTFLPVINDMVAAIARREGAAFDGPVGRAIRYALAPALADATSITLTTPAYPDEEPAALQARVEGREKVVEVASPRRAGVYELKFDLPDKTEPKVLFSRHIDPAEGDLAKADRAEIERAVAQPHTYQGGLATAASVAGRRTDENAYWWVLLAAVLGGLALEIVLARRFGHYAPLAAGGRGKR